MYPKERRRFARIKEQDAISYCVLPHGKSRRMLFQDLSAGGIRFVAGHFIPLHSRLKLEIKLKQAGKVIAVIAECVNVRQLYDDESYVVGARFLDIKAEDLRLLKFYLLGH